MKKVGFVGWRGMVGSVLMERLEVEDDFKYFESFFFSTSNIGGLGPMDKILWDATDVIALKKMDIILTCQGGDYTSSIYAKLRAEGWNGIWIDAASTLRMNEDSVLVLDPLNGEHILSGLNAGKRCFVGANCTVSLMLLAIHGLIKQDLVEWVSSMTYQAASGAGAQNMLELLKQMSALSPALSAAGDFETQNILKVDAKVSEIIRSEQFPTQHFGAPLAGSLIPWIDVAVEAGQTKEEWKGQVEANKILVPMNSSAIKVDGICVRMGAMRCHSQGLTLKLKKDIPLDEVSSMIAAANKWVHYIPNDKNSTLKHLTPAATSGTLTIPIGRVRKMKMGGDYLSAFTVGDQLLWGAAEPLRRVLQMITQS